MKVTELVVENDDAVGVGGFLHVRRLKLRNRRADGSLSPVYSCDFVERPMGIDAVAVAIYRRREQAVEVLLRSCIRPALQLGRDGGDTFKSVEIVAGIVEAGDVGEAGLRRRAAAEVWEEAGLKVEPSRIAFLGAASSPSAGVLAEHIYLAAAEVSQSAPSSVPSGDGSPMEEGGTLEWVDLDAAITRCTRGDIADMKTELALRRLCEHLSSRS